VADFSRDVRRVLREAGCYLVRQGKGDHEIWYSPITNTTFPVHGKIVSRHSANCLLKDAGLSKACIKSPADQASSKWEQI
jgi:predicted RNA binding protein YcfA (HicA-like mRNA interferase family)